MKRKAALSLLAAVLLLALAGCGGITREQYDALCAQRDALEAELHELKEGRHAEKGDTLLVSVGGTFAATVRDLIPDYVLDSTTPHVAVVTLFQSGPFTLQVGDLAEQLTVGETYVFEIETKDGVEITAEEYRNGPPFADEAMMEYGLRIAGFRPAGAEEFGLDSSRLVFERRD